jgi:hypothetical protein
MGQTQSLGFDPQPEPGGIAIQWSRLGHNNKCSDLGGAKNNIAHKTAL